MDIDIREASEDERSVLDNLMQLYIHEFAEFEDEPADVDASGRFVYPYLDAYWEEEDRTAFLVRVDGRLAGFALRYRQSLTGGDAATNAIAEFFVLRKYRRRGVGAALARWVFDCYPGPWEVAEVARNTPAQVFWRAIIHEYTGGSYREVWLDDDEWRGPVQVFDNSAR